MSAITESVAYGDCVADARRARQTDGLRFLLVFLAVIAGALFFMAYSIYNDVSEAGALPRSALPYVLLGVAMLIALGFEFVNGFHDTANAVATVIYTHTLPPQVAVVWSGCWNLSACSPRPARSPSASSRCCRWS